MAEKEVNINALVNLIDDPDEEIYDQIKLEILSHGINAIPYLEEAWEKKNYGPLFLKRIESLLTEINIEDVKEGFVNWKNHHADNLLMGLVLINKIKYPAITYLSIKESIDNLVKEAKEGFEEQLTSFEKIRHLNSFFFYKHHFEGNNSDYYAPENSYITDVLQREKGNAISLAVVYMLIANQLNIPLKGINLPKHFILGYEFQSSQLKADLNTSIKFYINPFSKGAILSEQDIDHFLDEIKVTPRRKFYNACSNIEIIIRILNNLKNSYSLLKNTSKIKYLSDLIFALKKK